MRYVLPLALAACGPPTPLRDVQPPPPSPELTPAFAKVEPWLGYWRHQTETMHWIAADGAMYGVWFTGQNYDHFTIHIVDDGEGAKPADGVLRFITIEDGRTYSESTELSDSQLVAFAHIEGYQRVKSEPATDLENADRKFASDVKETGIEGWVRAFEPSGGMMRNGARIEGAAIREAMADTLAEGLLAWNPIASGAGGVTGDLGYTVGKATYTPHEAGDPAWASTYITIWSRQTHIRGDEKVLFDTGRAVNR